jgi:hypothetical protein
MSVATTDPYRHEGLSLPYRFFWKLEWWLLHVYGPASLSEELDPRRQKERDRQKRQAHARAERLGISIAEARASIPLYSEARASRKGATGGDA